MIRYPTPSDHRYTDATNPAMPQGSGPYWTPGGHDTSQPAVTRDPEDRHGPSRLRANQLTSSTYASASAFSLTQRDSYPPPGQAQTECPEHFPYPHQQYNSGVNYAAPPFDLDYQIHSGIAYHGGQYATQPSTVTQFEYPPSDSHTFHHPATYDTTGYFTAEGQYCMPPGSQHQQNLVSDPSSYLRCDGSFDHYGTVTQHPILPVPPSSGSSELGNALVEIPSAEPQPTSRTSIALPSLPLPSQPATKHEPCEGLIGLNPIKTEYGVTAFSPMTPLDSTGDHVPFIKEEDDEQAHVGTSSMRRDSTPLHGHGSLCHRHTHEFRVMEDPTAYPGFASTTKRHPPPSLSIPGSLSYSPGVRINTPQSSSFSSSDTGTPTSSVNLMDNPPTSSSLPAPTLVPNPKAGQGVLKLPSTKRSARRKPAIACLFCRERKIACGAPPVGSADTTCNQCARRSRKCEYPTMSRRGLHKRRDNGGCHHRESEDADYVPTT